MTLKFSHFRNQLATDGLHIRKHAGSSHLNIPVIYLLPSKLNTIKDINFGFQTQLG